MTFNVAPRMNLRPLQFLRYLNVRVKPVHQLKKRTSPDYIKAPNSKLESLIWKKPLQNVFVTKKPWSEETTAAMSRFIEHLHYTYPEINVIVTEDVVDELRCGDGTDNVRDHVIYTGRMEDIANRTDMLVTLGGDGTILRGVSCFSNQQVPPVLAFSLGTLGFLLPFDFENHEQVFQTVMESRARCLHRTRIECHVVRKSGTKTENPEAVLHHAMNDVSLHRGSTPTLSTFDIYIDGDKVTTTTADGIIVSTPTGSTAYSLSAGGSIVSPLVPAIMVTPICPRSLSFRPLILPASSHIMIKLASRTGLSQESLKGTAAKMSIDGIPQQDLRPGDEIHVVNEIGTIYVNGTSSAYKGKKKADTTGVYCVAKTENDWAHGVNELLGFNSSFRSRVEQ